MTQHNSFIKKSFMHHNVGGEGKERRREGEKEGRREGGKEGRREGVRRGKQAVSR